MGFFMGLLHHTRLPPTPFMRSHNCLGRENAANDTWGEQLLHVCQMMMWRPYIVHIMLLLADCHGLLRGAAAPHEAAATPFTWSHNDLKRDNADNDTRSEELLHVRQMLLWSAFRCVTLL
jgi:hypothetical protein